MSSLKIKRLESLIHRELSIFFLRDSKLERFKDICLVEVRLTNDLSFLTVFYTTYNKEMEDFDYNTFLEKHKHEIKKYISEKVQIRKIPDIIFKNDKTLEYGNKIDDILKSLK